MMTIVKSPKQLLREYFAARRGVTRPARERRVGDWSKFHCGDWVYDRADERHIGRIRSIQNSAVATVVWEETGWVSEVLLSDLEHVKDETSKPG